MYDLIGFWTAVTLMTATVLAPVLFILYLMLCKLVKDTSGNRIDLDDVVSGLVFKDRNKRYRHERSFLSNEFCPVMVISAVSATLWFVISVIATGGKLENLPDSLVGIVSILAEFTAPFFGLVGILASIYFVLRFILSKMFTAYFSIKDKLDKL